MTVLDRSELKASPLSDLHLIASQLGVEGFRRLRKEELIDAILAHQGADGEPVSTGAASTEDSATEEDTGEEHAGENGGEAAGRGRSPRPRRTRSAGRSAAGRSPRPAAGSKQREEPEAPSSVEGAVEVLGNGSAFLRLNPPEPSDRDVYISAAQVRRCELVSGDRVSGPVRTPRRSERYPSLVRVETINGQPADSVAEGTRYEELPVAWPSERIAFDSEDPTLQAIEWLTPLGRGSRALICGAAHCGKTEALRRIAAALANREGVETTLVLVGVRPEEVGEWQEGPLAPLAALDFAASADAQGQAVESAVETAKRIAARGGDTVVLIDSLDGLHPHTARRVLSAARNLRDAGSLTIVATASRPFGGETTVIALDVSNTSIGAFPALDLPGSGTLRAELLVGEDGAQAIARERASAASK